MADIVDSPEDYFTQLMPARDALLKSLEAEAEAEAIPIVGPVVGGLLFVLARAMQANHILELGTATGYSAIYLGRACLPKGGRVLSLEYDTAMAERARRNLAQADLSAIVTVRDGDALDLLSHPQDMGGPYDLVFMDIEKIDYHRALEPLERLVRPSGLLIADNTAFKDADAFNQALQASSSWHSVQLFSYLPLHSGLYDGLCFAVRR